MLYLIYLMTIAAAALTIAAYWLHWRWTHRRMLQLASLLPGPPALPVIGNALIFMAKPEEHLNLIANMFHNYGKYVKFWLGPDLNVCISNPDDIRLLLTCGKLNKKGPLYKFVEVFVGPGILTGGPTWRHNRKLVNLSFSRKSLQHHDGVFNREAAALAEVISRKTPNVKFDVYCDVVHTTTQIVCQTLMGLSKADSLSVKSMNELIYLQQRIYMFIHTNMTNWWFQIPIFYWLSGRKKKEQYFTKLVHKMTSDILTKRRKALEIHPENGESVYVIDRLLEGGLTEQELIWETFTLFTASQEASAKIASAALVILAYLPDWQEKVYNEIKEVVGLDSFVTDEQLKQMSYLDAVYKEAIRLMPIGSFIQRTLEEEITINNGKYILPAGASLIIPFHMVQRDPEYWEEPNKAKPERFLSENAKNFNASAFMPFSLGAMDCLGRVYATSKIKTLLVHVVRRVELKADGKFEDLDLNVAISTKFAKGYNISARPREIRNRVNGEA